jgi:hypothetical protein
MIQKLGPTVFQIAQVKIPAFVDELPIAETLCKAGKGGQQ